MSKELALMRDIKYRFRELGYDACTLNECDEIMNALKRLETLDNAIEICKKANEQKYVYLKVNYGIFKMEFLDDLDYEVLKNRLYVNSRGVYYEFPLEDYGKDWALTKNELLVK